MKQTFIIVTCSRYKTFRDKGKAKDIYAGRLFRLVLKYAYKTNLKVYILSHKYGLIEPDTLIEHYDYISSKPFLGPWPKGFGYYVGSKKDFKQAPETISPLIKETLTETLGYGKQVKLLTSIIKNASETKIKTKYDTIIKVGVPVASYNPNKENKTGSAIRETELRNGIRIPHEGTITYAIWQTFDELFLKLNGNYRRKIIRETISLNKYAEGTIKTQYRYWSTFYGYTKK